MTTRTESLTPRDDWRLADWLAWQERLNPREIELGLERTREVARRLNLLSAKATSIIVGGTNGKGSSVTLGAAIYQAAGYRVGRFLSPHLLHYNERIAVDGEVLSDEALCAAFAVIERARGEVPLTYFEYGTLAALWLFRQADVDVQVLEVGLGGRLDAINVVDADCAIVTNIGLDHTDWLGPDRESIGREKAGIFRARRPAVCADSQPPLSLLKLADELEVDLRRHGADFSEARNGTHWRWQGRGDALEELPLPALPGDFQLRNAAGVLAAIEALQPKRPVPRSAVVEGLSALRLPGRLQRHGDLILDVAHNAEAAQALADYLRAEGFAPPRQLVLGMLADKPVETVGVTLSPLFDHIHAAGLAGSRGLSGAALQARLAAVGVDASVCLDVDAALTRARAISAASPSAAPIVVCGSFLTVAAALSSL